MGDVLVRLARRDKPVFAVTEAILDSGDYVMTDAESHYDPHVWMDVGGWMKAVEVVAEKLAAYDPAHAEDYRSNAA
ncbi:metal ABC transporter solute-binding protein, Zn/Mn family, partial [Tritonibacter sp. SIMBA_163]|uniref:metal ABC transporter solute-binding protein, Zn/Mn family n=1 Tax=Tritonibacter sp. SIMBA_163 TaxID=3080868 RepID=UPI003980B425